MSPVVTLGFLALLLTGGVWAIGSPKAQSRTIAVRRVKTSWIKALRTRLQEIERKYPGRVGLYVKDLSTQDEFSHQAEASWYVASGVKFPVAIEVFRQIDEGRFTLETELELGEDDYVDGAGETNSKPAGSRLSVRWLLEQMLIHSDNTGSDLLIGLVGLDQVNALTARYAPGFSKITSLADVRRLAYGSLYPEASRLKGKDFLLLKSVDNESDRVSALARLLGVQKSMLRSRNLDAAYDSYYASGVNSASLVSYGALLEKIERGDILSSSSRHILLDIMTRVETGKARIVAGFPKNVVFAHKTGTQRKRVCDFGLAWRTDQVGAKRVVIAACTKDFTSMTEAEAALRQVGESVAQSGVFEP